MERGETELREKTPAEVRAILAELRSRLEAVYGERLRDVYLFGSYARGEAHAGSDLDVLVVLDRVDSYWDEIERSGPEVAELSLDHDVSIIRVFVPEDQWRRADTPFLSNVRREAKAA